MYHPKYHPNPQDRAAAIRWARQMMKEDFVILDTETTGLDNRAVAISIGIIDKNGDVLLDTLIKPPFPIPASATAIHGITDEMVEDAPRFDQTIGLFNKAVKNKFILVYNLDYDLRILHQSAKAIDLMFWTTPHLEAICPAGLGCVMDQYAKLYGDWSDWHNNYRWQKLTDAARQCGLDTADAHGAVADCRMTLGVLQRMAEEKLEGEIE